MADSDNEMNIKNQSSLLPLYVYISVAVVLIISTICYGYMMVKDNDKKMSVPGIVSNISMIIVCSIIVWLLCTNNTGIEWGVTIVLILCTLSAVGLTVTGSPYAKYFDVGKLTSSTSSSNPTTEQEENSNQEETPSQ